MGEEVDPVGGKESDGDSVEQLRAWRLRLSSVLAQCRSRLLTYKELDRELRQFAIQVRRLLEPNSPAWRTFDREMYELPTEWSRTPYATYASPPGDCTRIETRQRILDAVFAQLEPEMEAVDAEDLQMLPEVSRLDLSKAKARLRAGDFSGALGAACGAIDAATKSIFVSEGLGDSSEASFQERVSRAVRAYGVIPDLEKDLLELGWDPDTSRRVKENLTGSINQAAYVMQTLRSRMGDAHGTQKVLEPLVYDSLKWAALILRLLQRN